MNRSASSAEAKLGLLMVAVFFSAPRLALSETFQGFLVPQAGDARIPIIVEIDNSIGLLSGSLKTSAPMPGVGLIATSSINGDICTAVSDIGFGRSLRLEGTCMAPIFKGTYAVFYYLDGIRVRGTFSLNRVKTDRQTQKSGSSSDKESKNLAGRSKTECLNLKLACLAGCPRSDNEETFLCVNRCKHKEVACKSKTSNPLEN